MIKYLANRYFRVFEEITCNLNKELALIPDKA